MEKLKKQPLEIWGKIFIHNFHFRLLNENIFLCTVIRNESLWENILKFIQWKSLEREISMNILWIITSFGDEDFLVAFWIEGVWSCIIKISYTFLKVHWSLLHPRSFLKFFQKHLIFNPLLIHYSSLNQIKINWHANLQQSPFLTVLNGGWHNW
jgi:hypothetical protein